MLTDLSIMSLEKAIAREDIMLSDEPLVGEESNLPFKDRANYRESTYNSNVRGKTNLDKPIFAQCKSLLKTREYNTDVTF